ncbi:cupin domain-containing protein [Colwellia sp. BRX10-3]|uniref:cupin domain-containing protein n=1 Tax=Colwellia sp. BRX10-3 TaxID=2759844 RepID=UPI0015F43314|nr:cupin domain-containing protein [Colwellia sp. BRX10-3]MBA6391524.1 cupin domain-containing protein [Colwellia sp. BRX10-3]
MINMDFTKRVVINTNEQAWQDSPLPGVMRKPLARENRESGHATSVVKYEAGASFSSHNHPLGEEILVLSGVFSDETGDFPAGSYFRNPKGFVHAPFSVDGCELLVKLHQLSPLDNQRIFVDTNKQEWQAGYGNLKVKPLHNFETESVALVFWPAGEKFILHSHFSGEEIYVISGELIDELGRYPAGSWIRSPHLSAHHPFVEQNTLIWVKTGHLAGS